MPCVNAVAEFVANSENAAWPVQINLQHNEPQSLFSNRVASQLHAHLRKKPALVTACQTQASHVGTWRHSNKINVSIEAGSALGNNAPAVLYNRGILDDD